MLEIALCLPRLVSSSTLSPNQRQVLRRIISSAKFPIVCPVLQSDWTSTSYSAQLFLNKRERFLAVASGSNPVSGQDRRWNFHASSLNWWESKRWNWRVVNGKNLCKLQTHGWLLRCLCLDPWCRRDRTLFLRETPVTTRVLAQTAILPHHSQQATLVTLWNRLWAVCFSWILQQGNG